MTRGLAEEIAEAVLAKMPNWYDNGALKARLHDRWAKVIAAKLAPVEEALEHNTEARCEPFGYCPACRALSILRGGER